MESKSFDDLNFGSELEKFILSHEALNPGDRLEGRVIQVKSDGKILIQFGKFRAVAESSFPMNEGEMLHVVVVAKKPKLKLRLETPQLAISTGIHQELQNLEMESEQTWSQIRVALQNLLNIREESLFPLGIRNDLISNDKKVKFKLFSTTPLHLAILLETVRLSKIRVDFFLVTGEKNLNITFYVENDAVKKILDSHLGEIEDNIGKNFFRLVINAIISEKKIREFSSESIENNLSGRKILDLKV